MDDPVLAADGHSYERAAIEEWLGENPTTPTQVACTIAQLLPNRQLRADIEEWMGDRKGSAGTDTPATPLLVCTHTPMELRETVGERSEAPDTLVNISLESLAQHRQPVHCVLLLDTSGSMTRSATKRNANNELEEFSNNLLDIVKLGAKAVSNFLGDNDYVSVIGFDSRVHVALRPTRTTREGIERAEREIESLSCGGCTAMGTGLQTALQIAMEGPEDCVRQICVLTDGMPNEGPDSDTVLESYHTKYPQTKGYRVDTFAFGYGNINTHLLADLAQMGSGQYTYIPDSSFVGTAFVHSTAAALCTMATDVTLEGCKGGEIPLGAVLCGQSRSVPVSLGGDNVSLTYRLPTRPDQVMSVPVNASRSTVPDTKAQLWHYVRHSLCSAILEAVHNAPPNVHIPCPPLAQQYAQLMAEAIPEVTGRQGESLDETGPMVWLAQLDKDYKEQMSLAFDPEHMDRWGRHYLYSICLSHCREVCNNHKDKSLAAYGGELHRELVRQQNLTFNVMPPPAASSSHGVRMTSAAAFNTSAGPCVHCDSKVALADGSVCRAEEVVPGTEVMVPGGQTAKVEHVLSTEASAYEHFVVFPGGLRITPFHPVRLGMDSTQWVFPHDVSGLPTMPCGTGRVYSYCLERPSPSEDRPTAMVIDSQPVIALGHGVTGDKVAAHPFYGTESVVHAMLSLPIQGGHRMLGAGCVVKDPSTGLACGFKK
ncbi:hypothetical protein KIPB_000386 [Kipferlia bialata]|uniref:U-box domain-containing protein n=1 Tax=Kipferlia bialata TaxID=797122 RepID=A0A9K3CMG0_9EUKA|nr:hypothetical protein KIPB_000386 [Kipferlia bialata]|eukprot:g386.t1